MLGPIILQVDIFNALNLLNKNWGNQEFASSTNDPALLTRSSFVGTNLTTAQGVFKYNTTFNLWNNQNVSSNYRLQAQIKYTF